MDSIPTADELVKIIHDNYLKNFFNDLNDQFNKLESTTFKIQKRVGILFHKEIEDILKHKGYNVTIKNYGDAINYLIYISNK
jgi:hypothetical protein